MRKTFKKSSVIIFVACVMLIGIILGWFLGVKVFNKKDDAGQKIDKTEQKEEIIKVNSADYEDIMNEGTSSMYQILHFSISRNDFKTNVELLDAKAKVNMAYAIIILNSIGNTYPITITYNQYKETYRNNFGEEFDGNFYDNPYDLKINGEMLESKIPTGLGLPPYYFTINKVTKLGNKYTIIFDIYDNVNGTKMEKGEKKNYKLQYIVEKDDNNYTYKSIKFI